MSRQKPPSPAAASHGLVPGLGERGPGHLDALDDFDDLEVTHVEEPGGGHGTVMGGFKFEQSRGVDVCEVEEREEALARAQGDTRAEALRAHREREAAAAAAAATSGGKMAASGGGGKKGKKIAPGAPGGGMPPTSPQGRKGKSRHRQEPLPLKRQMTRSGPHVQVPPNLTPESADVTPPQLMAMACETQDWWRIMTLAREHGPAVTEVHAGEERLTPLHHAALNDKREYAKDLALRCAAPTNAVSVYGDTPLIAAVQNCHHVIVKMLVADAKADTTIVGRFGLTALHWCSEMEGEMEAARCAELLLSHGADPVAEDEAGKTPLHWAALAGMKQLESLLLLRGGLTVIDRRDAAGRTAMYNAADKGRAGVVELLLKRGANANITDTNGMTPYAASRRHGHSVVQKLLRKHKSAPHSGPVYAADQTAGGAGGKDFVRAANGMSVPDAPVLGNGNGNANGWAKHSSSASWEEGSQNSKSTNKSSARSVYGSGSKKGGKCSIM